MNDNSFLKRPSKEDNEALQEMQKEFLERKFKPSVEIKSVHLEKPSTSALEFTKSDHNASSSVENETESSTVQPVFFDIVERDVLNFPITIPSAQQRSFSTRTFSGQTKKKKSIFMQEIEKKAKLKNTSEFQKSKINYEIKSSSIIIDGSGLGVEKSSSEIDAIHQENLDKLSQMNVEEIMKEKKLLEEHLSPDIIKFIQSRKKRSAYKDYSFGTSDSFNKEQKIAPFQFYYQNEMENLSGDINEIALRDPDSHDRDAILLNNIPDLDINSTKKTDFSEDKPKDDTIFTNIPQETVEIQDEELPINPKQTGKWLHMDKVEKDKLAWMTILPKPKPVDLKSGYVARFDFEGKLLSRNEDIPTQKGLHHHSDEPEIPGYSIEELFLLSRSSFQTQRITALNTLAHILENYWDGRFDGCFDSPLLSTLLSAGLVPLLRYALDDSSTPCIAAAVFVIHHLLVCKSDEICLDWTFCWQNGYLSPFLDAEDSEPNVNLEELTDTNIIKLDVIKGLLRMDILARFRYILKIICPAASVCKLILEICIRIARHSQESAKKIADFPDFLPIIFEKFLPLTWFESYDETISGKYVCPLYSALKLIRVIVSSSFELATLSVQNYHLETSIKSYITTDPNQQTLPSAYTQHFIIESLRTWKVLLCYDLCINIYFDIFPLLISHFRFCATLSLRNNVEKEIPNYEYATHLIKILESIVDKVGKQNHLSQSSADNSPQFPKWEHVYALLSMCETCLKRWLTEFLAGETNHAARLLLASCFDLFAAFCENINQKVEENESILKILKDVVDNYFLPFLLSSQFTSTLAHLRHCSLLLHSGKSGQERDCKVLTSLGSVCWKGDIIPLLDKDTPFPLLSSAARLIISVHNLYDMKNVTFKLLTCQPLIITYLESFISESDYFVHWFDKLETECLFNLLELLLLVEKTDTELCYRIALSLIRCFRFPFECFIEKIMKTVIFCPKFFSDVINNEISTDVNLSNVQNFYCSHFTQSEYEQHANCGKMVAFDSKIRKLLDKDWCYDPIYRYYEQSKNKGNVQMLSLDSNEIKYCLQWIHISSKLKYSPLDIRPSIQFISLCLVFLIDSNLFTREDIQNLLSLCLCDILSHQTKIPLEHLKWNIISDFEEIYSELIMHFENVSYGNDLFGIFVLFPLQQCYSCKWKQLLFSEFSTTLRFLRVPLTEIQQFIPIKNFLEPLEKDNAILRSYFKLLIYGTINQQHCPLLHKMACHHLHFFIKSNHNDSSCIQLQKSFQDSLSKTKNEKLVDSILCYEFVEET